jgi:hypothetical protein
MVPERARYGTRKDQRREACPLMRKGRSMRAGSTRPEFDSISSRYHRMDSLPNPVLIRVEIFLVRDIRTSLLYTSDLLYILITKLQILHTRDRTFATYPSLYNRVQDLDRKEGSWSKGRIFSDDWFLFFNYLQRIILIDYFIYIDRVEEGQNKRPSIF